MTAVNMFLLFCSFVARAIVLLVQLVILTCSLLVQGVIWCCVGLARLFGSTGRTRAVR